MTSPFLQVAVPSWIVPGSAADSVRLLRELPSLEVAGCEVVEVGLCCFEGQSSLDMPDSDYPSPADLAATRPPLSLHVHLPLNLHWAASPAETASYRNEASASGMVLALMRKFAHLGVTRAVLHPPPEKAAPRLALLQRFVDDWQTAGFSPADLLLENDAYCTAADFMGFLDALPVSVCVDVAHLIAYSHEDLLNALPPERVGLLHWSAPGSTPGKDAHRPLAQLTPVQQGTAGRAARRFAHALPLVEVFNWNGVCESLPILRKLYGL